MHEPVEAPAPAPVLSPAADLPWARELGAAFLAGLAGVVLLTARVWANPTRRLVGDWQAQDALSTHWVYDQIARHLGNFGGILHLSDGYAPVGDSVLSALGGAAPVLAAPLLLALGWPLGANVYVALVLAANVAAGSALARVAGAPRVAALVGGLCFGISPFFLTEASAGRLMQLPAWELAGALALWLTVLDRPDRRRGLLCAALFGLATLEYAWYGLIGAVAAGTLAIVRASTDGGRLRDGAWRIGVGLTGLAAVVASLPGIYVLQAGAALADPGKVPAPLALDYSLLPAWPLEVTGGPAVPAAVSWVLLALAGVGVLPREGRTPVARGLGAVLLVGWALSLGPRMLTEGGPVVDSHLPFFPLYSLLFPRFLYPYQHVVLVTLATAVLAARGLGVLGARLPRGGAIALAVAVLVAVPAELHARGVPLAPKLSHLASEPAWVGQLRALPEGAVLGLPLAPDLRTSQEQLLLQLLHGHPIVDGRSAWLDNQRPAAWDAFVAGSGLLVEVERFERGLEVPGDPSRANYFRYPVASVKALTDAGVRWVLVWDPLYGESIKGLARAERRLFTELCGAPTVTAEGLSVFDLTAHTGDGDLVAPVWRMPESVQPGDGTRRVSGPLAPGMLFERAP